MIKRFLRRSADKPNAWTPAAMPAHRRAYAVGDIHGRLDLFDELLSHIARDNMQRGPAHVDLILLGDYVDRGPDSAGVLDLLTGYAPPFATLHRLMGNHEEFMLASYEGSLDALRRWLRYGGWETLLSYGLSPAAIERRDASVVDLMRSAIPREHITLLRSLDLSRRIGDYLFVHAGIAPGVAIDEQEDHDLLWIREEFLDDDRDFGVVVVHGHTPARAPQLRRNRIGIDTAAYDSGCLTAVGLEGDAHWFIQTGTAEPPDRSDGRICAIMKRAPQPA